MRILRVGLVLGLVAAASACGSDDETATTTDAPPGTTAAPTTDVATEPATTTAPDTTVTDTTVPGTTVPGTTAAPTTEPPGTTTPGTTTPPTARATTTTPATTTPATTTAPRTVDVKVYFLRGERLAIAHRQVEGPAVLRATLTELLEGPSAADLSAGLHTEIPTGTALLGLNLANGRATVDLSRDLETGGGTLSMTARVAEIVFTATQFDNVDDVVFWLEGEPIDFLGGEGIVLDEPQTRADVEWAFTSGILIDSPVPGATVTSPFTVTGEGDVYEADFPMEVRRNGQRIGDVIIVFAGAWGEWADFGTTITLDVPAGPIEVVAWNELWCTPDSEPTCPGIVEIVVPLDLER